MKIDRKCGGRQKDADLIHRAADRLARSNSQSTAMKKNFRARMGLGESDGWVRWEDDGLE
jgi:hypothetical protein